MMKNYATPLPPTLTLPLEGGGKTVFKIYAQTSPSPLRGEGWGGGENQRRARSLK